MLLSHFTSKSLYRLRLTFIFRFRVFVFLALLVFLALQQHLVFLVFLVPRAVQ
jgi:hypothetical protein